MPVSYLDRYRVAPENWEAAERWVLQSARHLGLHYDRLINNITIYSSEELWVGGEEEEMTLNPDTVSLAFLSAGGWGGQEPYLRSIRFDIGGPENLQSTVDWKVSETSDDPPESLEELIEVPGNDPRYLKRAQKFPAFFELYTGVMQRLFPQIEHAHLHTDVGNYDEARKTSPSHMRKELWRTDLLTRLQGLRFPPMEIEDLGNGRDHPMGGAQIVWQPEGHTNYMIWFSLYVGADPKVCTYCDPTQSGSTTGWLSTRLIKNEEALNKLPYTLEQWANEDIRKKRSPEYLRWRKSVAELLRHHLPRELEEAWGAIRRQIIHISHEEMHTDTSGYDESIMKRLTEAEEKLPPNWQPLTPEEVRALKPGEEVIVNYHGKASPGKWKDKFDSDFNTPGVYTTYARIYQPIDPVLLTDPLWDPNQKEALHRYPIAAVGKEITPEHEELHTDTSGYDEAFLAALPESFKFKG